MKHIPRVLPGIALALRRNEADGVRVAANHAIVKDGLAVAKDEIDISLDEAMIEVLSRRGACAIGAGPRTLSDTRVERVLVTQDANVLKDVTIATHQQGNGL